MKIINNKTGMNNVALYNLTHNAQCHKAEELAGQTVTIKEWALVEDIDKGSGEQKIVLFFKTSEGTVHGAISRTLIEQFMDIITFFGDVNMINILKLTSARGRDFIVCELHQI